MIQPRSVIARMDSCPRTILGTFRRQSSFRSASRIRLTLISGQSSCAGLRPQSGSISERPSGACRMEPRSGRMASTTKTTTYLLPPRAESGSTALRVFLCFSSVDKSSVRRLFDELKRHGFDPWLDQEKLLAGQDWDFEIKRAVRETNVVLPCLSSASVSKPRHAQKETRLALDAATNSLKVPSS